MLTPYDIQQQARERRIVNESERRQVERITENVQGGGYAHNNSTRDRVRLSAERSRREASKLEAYLAQRRRLQAAAQPYDWEVQGV